MNKHPGRFVIGLTGNIATGKSVVRRMLEHLGAYTIDADALAHRAISKGAPGYQPVVDCFGKWILDGEGEIDRKKLGNLVFHDPEALVQLENIIHPHVTQAIEILTTRATQSVIVIEAIKLLESPLRDRCDSLWVVHAPEQVQLERLMRKRHLSREQALNRIRIQRPQEEKLKVASVSILNTGSYDDLWNQISAEWKKISPAAETQPEIIPSVAGDFYVQRGRPRDTEVIAGLLTRLSKGRRSVSSEEVMADFGEKAYLLLRLRDERVGLAGWQVENLVARTTDLYLDDRIDKTSALGTLIDEVERASTNLQCEASLVFPGSDLAGEAQAWKNLGYERRTPETLGIQAWQDAAVESMPAGTTLFFKLLRQDRVLRPI
ncbi:MAG: dephospho-CoA kinase [Chloroflexi bacterium RBG_16_51_16]|nr:MAG: dephospho-CoA kinase [Chloroflexi bacterium RBG_16_51_16]